MRGARRLQLGGLRRRDQRDLVPGQEQRHEQRRARRRRRAGARAAAPARPGPAGSSRADALRGAGGGRPFAHGPTEGPDQRPIVGAGGGLQDRDVLDLALRCSRRRSSRSRYQSISARSASSSSRSASTSRRWSSGGMRSRRAWTSVSNGSRSESRRRRRPRGPAIRAAGPWPARSRPGVARRYPPAGIAGAAGIAAARARQRRRGRGRLGDQPLGRVGGPVEPLLEPAQRLLGRAGPALLGVAGLRRVGIAAPWKVTSSAPSSNVAPVGWKAASAAAA